MPGWLHLFYCGHWVRLNFTPGIPQSHTVWFAVSLARVEVPFSSAHVGQKAGAGGQVHLEGSPKSWANACPLSLHTQPGFLFWLCLSQLGLSVPILCSFLAFEPSIISTWALSSLQLSPAAQTPSGSWLMAFLLTLAQLMSISPAANPTSLGGEATSVYCSPLPLATNTNCNGPLMGPSRMSQGSVDRGFRI